MSSVRIKILRSPYNAELWHILSQMDKARGETRDVKEPNDLWSMGNGYAPPAVLVWGFNSSKA